MYLIDFVVNPLEYTFMQRALLVTVTASIVCASCSGWPSGPSIARLISFT